MPIEIRLLIVEDNEEEIRSWQRTIERYNASAAGIELVASYAVDAGEAMNAIKGQDFDAAVVDIRLKAGLKGDTPDASGNIVLEQILKAEMAVVAAYSGETNAVEIPNGADHIVKFEKGGGNGEVLNWLTSQAGMIDQIRIAQTMIRREMARVFVRSVWPRWQNWLTNDPPYPQPQIRNALARHITSHVLVSLLGASEQKAHAEEWYFVPPVGDKLMTGDLIESEGKVEVVITPRCDIATDKYSTIQLASCEPCVDDWKKALAQIAETSKSGKMSELLQHSKKSSEHFLPPMRLANGEQKGPYRVQFTTIRSVPKTDADALVPKRVATLTPEFLPSLVERLGAYFSRIGTPDYLHLEPEVATGQ